MNGALNDVRHAGRAPLVWFWPWLLVGWLMVAGIVYLSLAPFSTPGHFPYQDKLSHLAAYFILMGWFVQLFSRPRHLLWLVVLIGLGVGLEFLQGATRYRSFEYADMAANSIGVAAAWLAGATQFAHLLTWFERRVLRLGPAPSAHSDP